MKFKKCKSWNPKICLAIVLSCSKNYYIDARDSNFCFKKTWANYITVSLLWFVQIFFETDVNYYIPLIEADFEILEFVLLKLSYL